LSSCIGVSGSRFACFGVEADQKLAGECNANDHFFLSRGDESGAEGRETLIIACGCSGNEEQNRTNAGPTALDVALAFALPTIVGKWGEAG